jgi:hypothetical protein
METQLIIVDVKMYEFHSTNYSSALAFYIPIDWNDKERPIVYITQTKNILPILYN